MIMDPEKNEFETRELDLNDLEGVEGGMSGLTSIRQLDRTGIVNRTGLTETEETGKVGGHVRSVDNFKRTPDLDV